LNEHTYNFDEFVDRHGSDCKKYSPVKYTSDVLPMWIADTDFKVAKEVIAAAEKRAEHPVFGYPYELPAFNTAVQGWMKRRHNWDISTDSVEFATGVIPAHIFCIRAFTHPGDKIVCQTPLYPPLREAVVDNGRTLVNNVLINNDGHFEIDFEDLDKKLADPRTTMFILCNPHNPTGRSFNREELEKIAELCLKNDVFVFADEIHADITFSGHEHVPFASLSKEISDITITGINPGKAFNVAGVRTAAVIIENKKLMDKYIISRKNNKGMGRTVFGQNVFIACYENGDDYVDQEVAYLEKNLDYLDKYLKENVPEIKFHKAEATYLMWLDCRELGLSQAELLKLFEEDGKLGMNDGATFGTEGIGFVRMNIAAPKSTVEEGCKRLKKAVDAWKERQ